MRIRPPLMRSAARQKPVRDMSDLELEAALAGILARLSEGDDPALADRMIDILLNRIGDDQAARMAAIKRLTRDLLADVEVESEPLRARSNKG